MDAARRQYLTRGGAGLLGLGAACFLGLGSPSASSAAGVERAGPDGASGPVTMVIPFPAGGGSEVLTRQLGIVLERLLGQPVVVVNRPGAAGLIGAESVARAAPDGRTLLVSSVNMAIQAALNPQARVNPVRDFDHLSLTGAGYSIVAVAASSPYRSLEQLLDVMRREPDRLSYGSGGIGSLAHFVGLALLQGSGTRAVHIPYRGSVDLFPALENADIAFACPVQSTAMPLVRQGKLRPLAISAPRPSALLPGVPTLAQVLGTPNAVIEGWAGLSAPRGLAPATRQRLHAAIVRALAEPVVQDAAMQADVPIVTSTTPQDYASFVEAEVVKFNRLAQALQAA